jgi:hypothetical protein
MTTREMFIGLLTTVSREFTLPRDSGFHSGIPPSRSSPSEPSFLDPWPPELARPTSSRQFPPTIWQSQIRHFSLIFQSRGQGTTSGGASGDPMASPSLSTMSRPHHRSASHSRHVLFRAPRGVLSDQSPFSYALDLIAAPHSLNFTEGRMNSVKRE